MHWLEAHSSTNETSIKKASTNKPILTHSIGYLIAENKDGITMVSDTWPKHPNKGRCEHFIGWGMIHEWWEYI